MGWSPWWWSEVLTARTIEGLCLDLRGRGREHWVLCNPFEASSQWHISIEAHFHQLGAKYSSVGAWGPSHSKHTTDQVGECVISWSTVLTGSHMLGGPGFVLFSWTLLGLGEMAQVWKSLLWKTEDPSSALWPHRGRSSNFWRLSFGFHAYDMTHVCLHSYLQATNNTIDSIKFKRKLG